MNDANRKKAKLTRQLGYVIAAVSAVGGFIMTIVTQGMLWLIMGFVSALFIGTIYDTLGTILEELVDMRSQLACTNQPSYQNNEAQQIPSAENANMQ